MLTLGDRQVRLCLLDTNAVSEMVKHPDGAFRRFLDWAMGEEPIHVSAFSLFTIMELRRSAPLFESFVEFFHPFPAVVVKGHEELLAEKAEQYPYPSTIDPCSFALTPLGGEGNKLSNLPTIMATPFILERERYWNEHEAEIVEGMVSLVPNYPPQGTTYTPREVRTFLENAGLSQLAMRQHDFAASRLAQGEAVEIDAFPSLKASLLTAFHKFYADRQRQPSRSDEIDIIISASTPYVEAIVTENHQAEALGKIARLDPFMNHVQVLRLSDLRP